MIPKTEFVCRAPEKNVPTRIYLVQNGEFVDVMAQKGTGNSVRICLFCNNGLSLDFLSHEQAAILGFDITGGRITVSP